MGQACDRDGRAAAAIAITLTLDDYVPDSATARYIGLRIPGERGYRVFGVATFTGPSKTLTLTDAWPSGVAFPGAAGNPAHDTIWIYDFKATPGQKVRVVSVQPQAGLTGASVAVVPELTEFWDYVWNGDYTPPVSQSLLPFGLPAVAGLSVSEELRRQGNAYDVELTAMWSASGAYRSAQVWGATAGNELQKLGETPDLRWSWRANLDEVWSIEVRPFGTLGRTGTLASAVYTVAGLSVASEVAVHGDKLHAVAPLAAPVQLPTQRELGLHDLAAQAKGLRCVAIMASEEEVMGVNDRVQLSAAEAVMQRRLREAAMRRCSGEPDPTQSTRSASDRLAQSTSRCRAVSMSSRSSRRVRVLGSSFNVARRRAMRARASGPASGSISTSRSAVMARSKVLMRLAGRQTTSVRRLSSAVRERPSDTRSGGGRSMLRAGSLIGRN